MVDFKAMQARIKMQDAAKVAVRAANYNASLLITVGGGKGKLMIDLALELIRDKGIKKILYVCDNRRLRDSTVEGFPEQLATWGTPELKKMVRLECYQTTRKWENEQYDLILADEFDFGLTPEYSKIFFNNKFKYKILVSGTLNSDKKKIINAYYPIVFTFNTLKAEKEGVINKSNYYIFNYRMNESESRQYIKWTQMITVSMADGSSRETINFFAGKRREVLATLDTGFLAVRKVMDWLWKTDKSTRLVVFCERTFQADRVCRHSYHGGNEKLDNLKKFQDGEISGLSVVSKIKRGINLKNANTAIFESLNSSATEFEQRNGRMKRLKTSEIAKIIFMLPWYQTETGEWKPTVVSKYIDKATVNIKATFEHLKL